MTEIAKDQVRHQDQSSPDEGDHAIDGAFKFQDTKLARAAGETKSSVTNNLQGAPPNGPPADSTDGLEQVTNTEAGYGNGPSISTTSNDIEVLCGPLLNYKSLRNTQSNTPVWHGTVLIVTKPGKRQPQLQLKFANFVRDADGSRQRSADGNNDHGNGDLTAALKERSIQGIKLYADPVKTFWRFDLDLPLQESEARWEYTIPRMFYTSGVIPRASSSYIFVVPGVSQSMRIMFHSCNGFSVGTDENAWSGPALWNDVLRVHEQRPFHVMIGGGDQIYNDGVRVAGPLRAWTDISNPKKRREYPFDRKLRDDCDLYYFNNYIKWFSTEPFASANHQIPQVNVWDDHGNTTKEYLCIIITDFRIIRYNRWVRLLHGSFHEVCRFSWHRWGLVQMYESFQT